MQCFIYRSAKQDEMYLYLKVKDGFDVVPLELSKRFGRAEFVMALDLAQRDKLARVDIVRVQESLMAHGFFLQVPPTLNQVLHDGD